MPFGGIVILALVLMFLASAIRIIKEYQLAVIFRLSDHR
jgi:regulator of protease activity HflC (stomatin/prohibitin superfamily)